MGVRSRLRKRFRDLARAAAFLAAVAVDGDAPRRARVGAGLVLAYALLPVDLVPDPSGIGLVDDFLVLKVGEPGVRRMVPREVAEASSRNLRRWVIILGVAWILSLLVGLYLLWLILT